MASIAARERQQRPSRSAMAVPTNEHMRAQSSAAAVDDDRAAARHGKRRANAQARAAQVSDADGGAVSPVNALSRRRQPHHAQQAADVAARVRRGREQRRERVCASVRLALTRRPVGGPRRARPGVAAMAAASKAETSRPEADARVAARAQAHAHEVARAAVRERTRMAASQTVASRTAGAMWVQAPPPACA